MQVDSNHKKLHTRDAKEDGDIVKAAEQEFGPPTKIKIINVKSKRCLGRFSIDMAPHFINAEEPKIRNVSNFSTFGREAHTQAITCIFC